MQCFVLVGCGSSEILEVEIRHSYEGDRSGVIFGPFKNEQEATVALQTAGFVLETDDQLAWKRIWCDAQTRSHRAQLIPLRFFILEKKRLARWFKHKVR